MSAPAACPEYAIHDTVQYRDRHGRLHVGRVICIEAKWPSWGDTPEDNEPYIIYTVEHPTYSGRRCYCGPESILGAAA